MFNILLLEHPPHSYVVGLAAHVWHFVHLRLDVFHLFPNTVGRLGLDLWRHTS